MIATLLTQLVLPLGLMSWLAFRSAGSALEFVLQVASTGLALFALSRVSLWMFLPFWLPYLYAVIFAAAVVKRLRPSGFRFATLLPHTVRAWAVTTVFLLLGIFSAYLTAEAALGRQLPDAEIADISMPLDRGIFVVAHGGSKELINAHLMTLDPSVPRFKAYRGQYYALDLFEINRLGFRANGLQPRDPEQYKIFGQPVLAPCEGTVVVRRDDRPDMPVPEMDLDTIEGNHVLLDCEDFELLLAHFQQGTVTVTAGDKVSVGDELGLVGNSGKTTEPHLHISAQKASTNAQRFSGEPMAITIEGEFYVRNDRLKN
ncbi:MAG: M23 family metallopeptidase [Halioglobus sp.]